MGKAPIACPQVMNIAALGKMEKFLGKELQNFLMARFMKAVSPMENPKALVRSSIRMEARTQGHGLRAKLMGKALRLI